MKSLVLIRCPLMRRKRYLGIFKSRHKVLSRMFLENVESALTPDSTFIHCSSFSKNQAAAQVICDQFNIDSERMLNINPNLQDLDTAGCIRLLNQTSNSIDTVVFIAPSVTISALYAFFSGERKIFASGSAELVRFQIGNWSTLDFESFHMNQVKVFKSA